MSESEIAPITGNWQLMDLVRKNSGLRKNAQFVAMHMAGDYYPEKGYSRSSVSHLAQMTGLTARTISNVLNEILASGEWIALKKQGASTFYYPDIRKLSTKQEVFVYDSKAPAVSESQDDATKTAKPVVEKKPLAEPLVNMHDFPDDVLDVDFTLPLYDPSYNSNSATIPANIVRPKALDTSLAYAQRLYKKTPLATRVNKDDFTVSRLKDIYDNLSNGGYPMEAIDILLWVQCEDRDALNEKFLRFVLSKCTSGHAITRPTQQYDATNPAIAKAFKVWEIYSQRQSRGGSKWVEFI